MKVLDYTGTSHLVSKTKTELAKKVDKVTGKGLSTNDYTNAEKQKVADSLTDAPSDGKQYARQDGGWEELDLDGKANIDGYYDTLSVGLADNLIDRKGNGTPQEISYRTSCGDDSIADDGNGIIQSIFGKTVVWNQIANPTVGGTTVNGITYTKNADGSYTANGTATSNSYFIVEPTFTQKCVVGHTYYMEGVSGGSSSTYRIRFFGEYVEMYNPRIYTLTQAAFDDGAKAIDLRVMSGTTVNNLVFNPKVYDLTAMFGSGNEPTTVDDPRIEWIKQYANDHPEYNSGELISYNGSGIKTVGFNLFDKDSTEINADYRRYKLPIGKTNLLYMSFKDKDTSINVSDLNVGFMQGEVLSPSNPHIWCMTGGVIKSNLSNISTNYGGVYCDNLFIYPKTNEAYTRLLQRYDICVNIQWSGYRNGEYEPYWSRTLALPISTYFPDGMKSAGSVRDELTKDKAVKRIGKVDLGSLEWSFRSDWNAWQTTDITGYKRPTTASDLFNAVSDNYPIISANSGAHSNEGIFASSSADRTWVNNGSTTITPSGYLYYELATPTETTITPPLDLTYKVADFGTEESIAEGKSTPFNGIIKYSDDFTRGLVNMPKNYDTTASLDALATSLSTMLTSALDGTVTITRGAYDSTNKKYAWNCSFTPNA